MYSSTDVANLYLAEGSAKSLHHMIIYQSQTIYPLWNNLADAVRLVAGLPVPPSGGPLLHRRWNGGLRTICRRSENKSARVYLLRPCREGKNQNQKTFGLPAEEVFQAIYRFVLSVWRVRGSCVAPFMVCFLL